MDEQVINEIVSGLAERPSEMTYSSVWYFGDVVRSVAADATAFGDRSQPWLLSIDAIWSRREDDAFRNARISSYLGGYCPIDNTAELTLLTGMSDRSTTSTRT